ncbi:MAG: hypothetical protein U0P45_17200 [Acidimicrobiales bacterium]
MTTKPPPAPAGTGPSGRRLWRSVTADFDLAEHELALLREAVRTVDQLDALAAVVADAGSMVDTPQGPKVHPALVEARQLRLVLARLVASLRVPDEEGEQPQRRGAARRPYNVVAS